MVFDSSIVSGVGSTQYDYEASLTSPADTIFFSRQRNTNVHVISIQYLTKIMPNSLALLIIITIGNDMLI